MTRYGIKPAYEGVRTNIVSITPQGGRGLVNFFCTKVEIEGQEYHLVSHVTDATGYTGDPVLIGELLMDLLAHRDDVMVLPLLTELTVKDDDFSYPLRMFQSLAHRKGIEERRIDSFVSDIFEIEQPGYGAVLMRLDTCPEADFRAARQFF